ncbi:MAG: DNA primase [Bacteroidaceae bacterium]|nr:DNA primase [Bacteroidaceae bacterium]
MIDRLTVDRILDTANIVDVVSDFVTLKRSGANLKGLCPFHDDRTPSFMVSPAKNICKCFACGVGGRPVDFIMKHEQLSYYDALRYLAKKYGIEIQERELTDEEKQSQTDRDSMFILNDWAKDWFQNQLNNSPMGRAVGMAYFHNRGFRDDIIARFQLGFCPDQPNQSLAQDALKAGYQEKYLTNTINQKDPRLSLGTGLCLKNDNGTLRDRFRGRVIWPIFTVSGRVAGFGGRVLDSATKGVNVKYLNSPESIIYSKRKELFGLYQAKEAIRKRDLCYLVEGYTDVMAMHQHGVENVVASSGTALTTEQIRLIHRMTNNITVIYDGDEAGIHASERGIDMLLAEGMNVKLLLLPDGDDPDSFARKHTATEYQQYLSKHQTDFIQYKTAHLMQTAKDDPNLMGKLVHSIAASIAAIPDEITQVAYTRQASQILQMEERLIANAVLKQRRAIEEEKRRDSEREARRASYQTGTPLAEQQQSQTGTPSSTSIHTGNTLTEEAQPTPPYATPQHSAHSEADSKASNAAPRNISQAEINRERELMRLLMTKGETIVCITENEDQQDIKLTAFEFVSNGLQEDNIQLYFPLYNRILDEGLKHLHDEGFTAERFFAHHPDTQISTLSFELTEDKEPLSKIHSDAPEEQRYDDNVIMLVNSIKLYHAKMEAASLCEKLKRINPKANPEEYRQLFQNYVLKDSQVKRLAKECGNKVVIN